MSFWKTLGTLGGAGLGLALGGPGGAMMGANLGGTLGGALGGSGGSSSSPSRDRAPDPSADALRSTLTAQATGPVTMDAGFRARIAELAKLSADRERRDTASLAARGLTGSSAEIAYAAERGRTMASQQTAALDAATAGRSEAQARLLALLGLDARRDEAQANRDAAGRAATFGALGQVAGAALPAVIDLLGNRGPGVPTDPVRNPSSAEMLGHFR